MQPVRTTLGNGLQVVVVPLPHLHQSYVGLWVRAGARFEDERTSGISHLVEHALHAGSRRFPDAHARALEIERIGGDFGAFTSDDACGFPLIVPPEFLDEGSALLAELVTRPTFGEGVSAERRRVLEEILEGEYDNDDAARALVFKGQALARPVLGPEENVAAFRVASLRRWHRRHFTAKNSVLVFTGAVEERTALRLARRDFGHMRRGRRIESETPPQDQGTLRTKLVPEKNAPQTTVYLCFRAPNAWAAGMADMLAAGDVLAHVLDGSGAARLPHRLCDSDGLCYTATATFLSFDDAAYLEIVTVSRDPAAVVPKVFAMLGDLARRGPTAEELTSVRRRIVSSRARMADSLNDMARFYAREALLGRESSVEEDDERRLRVTADEVRDVARAMARRDRVSVFAVGSKRKLGQVRKLVRAWRGYTP